MLSGAIRYNGSGAGKQFSGALMIECPELGTQLWNSETRTAYPALGIVPYDLDTDLARRFLKYEPQFPLELQCSNETQVLINTLSIRIREFDGTLADCFDPVERTYIVVRIETEQDIERQVLYDVKREQRKKVIEASLALFRQPPQ
jgi:hypothetical protein